MKMLTEEGKQCIASILDDGCLQNRFPALSCSLEMQCSGTRGKLKFQEL